MLPVPGGPDRGHPAPPLLVSPLSPPSPGCPTDWDGLSCWPALPLGQSRAVACPDILNVFKKSEGLVQRNCTERGWSLPSPPYHSSCQLEPLGSSNDTEATRGHFVTMKVLYTCGHCTSLAALLLAIGIFRCFRKLHCTRNSIHIHFFTSFILRGSAVFIKDSVLFSDESADHCTMSTVTCKAAIAFLQYSVLANFYWLLVEGLYLQTLLLLTFTCDRSYTWGYILVGWGEPGDVPGTAWEWPDLRPTRGPQGCSQRAPTPTSPAAGHPAAPARAQSCWRSWPDPGQVLPCHTHPGLGMPVPGARVRWQGAGAGGGTGTAPSPVSVPFSLRASPSCHIQSPAPHAFLGTGHGGVARGLPGALEGPSLCVSCPRRCAHAHGRGVGAGQAALR
uniref:Vasoactive intestinal peptide receptor 1 n=1 Tax=Ficedula albicollis TaxID=59894 RepID=A0A803VTQ5_FICAL